MEAGIVIRERSGSWEGIKMGKGYKIASPPSSTMRSGPMEIYEIRSSKFSLSSKVVKIRILRKIGGRTSWIGSWIVRSYLFVGKSVKIH